MESEWEEVTMMMELPSSSHVDNRRQGYFQILGISTDKPLVKINGQLYTGQCTDTLGSHLFLEVDDHSDKEAAQRKKQIKSLVVTSKSLKLEPVYLNTKKDSETL